MAPTLTAAVQQQTRVLLTLTWPGVKTATIQRLDPDGVPRNVRNAEPIVCLDSCAVFDHEAPLDQAVTYQATSPQGTGQVANDAFGRTVSSSWGTADSGQTYTIVPSGGTSANFSVTGGQGQIQPSVLADEQFSVITVGSANRRIQASVSLTALPGSNDLRIGLCPRYVDQNNYVLGEAFVNTSGGVTVRIVKRVAGVATVLASTVSSITLAINTKYTLAVVANGTTLQAKFWLAGGIEPTTWDTTVVDDGLTTGTLTGVFARNDSAATTPVFKWDDLFVYDLSPLTVTSSSLTVLSGGQAWLTHPGHPAYAGTATVTRDGLSEIRPARRGLFFPIGSALPIAVSDVRGGSNGTLVVQTSTAADVTRLRNMLTDGMALLLRQPSTWGGDTWYLSIGDVDINRFTQIATDGWRRWTLPYQRVDRPPGSSDGAVGVTCNDVKATYGTCTALTAAKATCTALAQSVT